MKKRIEILVSSTPDRPAFGYGDHISVTNEFGQVLTGGHCSTCPNPFSSKDKKITWKELYAWISLGTYTFKYTYSSKYGYCILINEGRKVRARFMNPNKKSNCFGTYYMDEILIHKGGFNCSNPNWRGSAGCITIPQEEWQEFISCFRAGDIGELVIKPYIEENKMVKKSMFRSKTLWFNVISMAVIAVDKFSGIGIVPDEVIAAVITIGNFALRFFTKKAI